MEIKNEKEIRFQLMRKKNEGCEPNLSHKMGSYKSHNLQLSLKNENRNILH